MTTTKSLRATLRSLGVADIISGVVGLAASSWLADQLGLATVLVAATAGFLVVFGSASLMRADQPSLARATIAVEAGSALTLVGVLAIADTTTTGNVIALALAGWCIAAALSVTTLVRRPGSLAVT